MKLVVNFFNFELIEYIEEERDFELESSSAASWVYFMFKCM